MVGSTFAWQLEDHTQLEGINLDLTNAPVSLTNSVVNISNSMAPTYWSQSSYDIQFQFESTSHLRWISPSIISDENFNTEFGTSDSILDIMWNVEVHVLNQYLNHIPYSTVNYLLINLNQTIRQFYHMRELMFWDHSLEKDGRL